MFLFLRCTSLLCLIILDFVCFNASASFIANLLKVRSNGSDCVNFIKFYITPPPKDKMNLIGTLHPTPKTLKMLIAKTKEKDPMEQIEVIINGVLFGKEHTQDVGAGLAGSKQPSQSRLRHKAALDHVYGSMFHLFLTHLRMLQINTHKITIGLHLDDADDSTKNITQCSIEIEKDPLAHYPSGQVMRAELFENKSGVHLPVSQFVHRGHSYLKITKDHMQTAVNAFMIFLYGTLDDVLRLPPLYVLHSTRTISMMKIAREKLVATWKVIKGHHRTNEITHQTLEMYRPLFKYINGREIAKLNLSDERILSYIGTHADLDRHQVGVVASRYIKLNKHWNTPKYLNLMNNLICGVPLLYMRMLSENTYLQLTHQLFYHIRSCDPLQRRFYLHLMTRTQVLGKSNSWSASDVARLGLLLTEVETPELTAINPKAMSGITAQVMLEMQPQKLKHLTEAQMKYIGHKPMNILAKKMHRYQDMMMILNSGETIKFNWLRLGLALKLRFLVLAYILNR